MYIYQQIGWPAFEWDHEKIALLLVQVRHCQGRLIGGMETIGFHFSDEVMLQTLTQDVVKTSEIEGEVLEQSLVRSSVARRLGLEDAALGKVDREVEGVVEMLLDATQKYDREVTKKRLLEWHASLFPAGQSGYSKITVGGWRKGTVQVISGPAGREVVHFEGPPAQLVDDEIEHFLVWLNTNTKTDPVLKAAIAHLWFETIHPFEDGNGRIGRAIADLLLARSEHDSRRFYSLSAQIQTERKGYYKILEQTQKGGLDITPWIEWFLNCLMRAMTKALSLLHAVKEKERVWRSLKNVTLNERQRKIINRLLDGFEGKLTTSKWAKIAKCSQDTAYRDIQGLISQGVLIKNAEGGRSTSYSLMDNS